MAEDSRGSRKRPFEIIDVDDEPDDEPCGICLEDNVPLVEIGCVNGHRLCITCRRQLQMRARREGMVGHMVCPLCRAIAVYQSTEVASEVASSAESEEADVGPPTPTDAAGVSNRVVQLFIDRWFRETGRNPRFAVLFMPFSNDMRRSLRETSLENLRFLLEDLTPRRMNWLRIAYTTQARYGAVDLEGIRRLLAPVDAMIRLIVEELLRRA